ncbi:hypothetical protein OG426_54835 (plasmid) [Streptomyces canus]|uniref:hypothetical protein n=1 Tax=Streptomyces canus TaxID=58343 RepID=UPI002F90DA5D|nr:hypothetical protein OG426_54835 [Streptomyces canus]
MGDVAKGVLAGAWTLLVGWILPTAVNLAVCFFAVVPSLRHTVPFSRLWPTTGVNVTLLLLTGAVVVGLVLNALQIPLYRILEGYLLWPAHVYTIACARRRQEKWDLQDRLRLLRLKRQLRARGRLPVLARADLTRLTQHSRIARASRTDSGRTTAQRGLLREKLARYPVDDEQIAPTRLGNAIRRHEEYGYDHFRLDTQVLWNELTGTAPEQLRRQVDLARSSVDFFVALLAGHAAVISAALAALASTGDRPAVLIITAAILGFLIPVWYWCAVSATDEWAAAVRALVNTGRSPLADGLGLVLPATLTDERAMWSLVGKFSRLPYSERAAALNGYRRVPPAETP